MVSISDMEADILLKIYIGQNIRDEGILQSEFGNQEKEIIKQLISKNLVRENHWYLYQYLTTPKGSKIGKELVNEKIEKYRNYIEDELSKLPEKGLRYIIKNFVRNSLSFSKKNLIFLNGMSYLSKISEYKF